MTASTERASPLSDYSACLSAVSAASSMFSIREVPFATQINLRGNAADAAFTGKARPVLGYDLPAAANTWNGGSECAALWLGPDEWLVVAPGGSNETLCSALRNALAGTHHAVTDVSANRTIIEIAGENARVVLAKGCPLDLHASSFKPPQTAQTLLAKSQVILQCVDAQPTFRLFVRISFAHYIADWLIDAATELGASRNIDSDRIASRLA